MLFSLERTGREGWYLKLSLTGTSWAVVVFDKNLKREEEVWIREGLVDTNLDRMVV